MAGITLCIRSVQESDAEILLDWSNDPLTRQNSLSSRSITLQEHLDWLRSKLTSKSDWLYLMCHNDQAVGLVRFQQSQGEFEVSYQLAPAWRGRGLGVKLLQLGTDSIQSQLNRPLRVVGVVKPDNLPSLRIFEKLGFEGRREHHRGQTVVVFSKQLL